MINNSSEVEMSLKEKINMGALPKHVAIIMDGNGRWAQKRGNMRIFGHKNGVESVRQAVETAGELQIGYLTLYAFSTENWSRPKAEIDALMGLLINAIQNETENLNKNNVRLTTIGDRNDLPSNVRKQLEDTIAYLDNNTGLTLNIALSYSGRWEITSAMKKIAEEVKEGRINPDEINSHTIETYLNTSDIPDPELLIRTSGELRISNFLLWQLAYTELYFTPVLWPDFRREHFYEAIIDYQGRERRFGGVKDQGKIETANN